MLYRTLYFPENPKAEYQRVSGRWYKRAIGSNDVFVPVAEANQKYMESYFSKRYGFLYQYSNQAKIGAVALLSLGVFAYLKFYRKSGVPKV
jgi:hypothetical protein